MNFTYTMNGEPLAYGPFHDAEGTLHPAVVLDLWSDDDLVNIGVVRTETPPPPPPRRLIAKSKVQERVNDIGKLGDVFDALNSDPILFARWFAPDWPNVYFDDEGLLGVLASVGCTPEQIEEITAP